mgnify:CR=1 FL=1
MSLIANLFRKAIDENGKISLIRQTKPGGDGLACVAMIFMAHNSKESMTGLQKKYPQFSSGMSLKTIIDIFNQYGFVTRPLHCPIDEIQNIQLPCIVHWDMKQFVVLNGVDGGIFTVLNPADKKSRYTKDEFEQHYSEVALEVLANNNAL